MDSKPKEWPLARALETYSWLEQNLPAAVEWFTLWRLDDASKRHAVRMAKDLPPHRRHHLIRARADVERESALGLLAELILAEERLARSLKHQMQPGLDEHVQHQRARIAELVAELQIDAAPTTEPKS